MLLDTGPTFEIISGYAPEHRADWYVLSTRHAGGLVATMERSHKKHQVADGAAERRRIERWAEEAKDLFASLGAGI